MKVEGNFQIVGYSIGNNRNMKYSIIDQDCLNKGAPLQAATICECSGLAGAEFIASALNIVLAASERLMPIIGEHFSKEIKGIVEIDITGLSDNQIKEKVAETIKNIKFEDQKQF